MSGRITIDNLSASLKEIIEDNGLTEAQVIQLIESNISGDLDLLNTTDKSSLVAAINELFQSANNGKELIANAIGEPLNAEDTFSAMSNDINGLLSTFKTNMMNNGITVESSDKFKSMIDKIATMVEEGEGKGIQYASGDGTISSLPYSSSGYQTYVINTNLDFTPTVLFWTVESLDYRGAYGSKTGWELYGTANSLINVSGSTCLSCSLSDAAYDCNFYLSNVNSESFTLNYEISLSTSSGVCGNVVYHWYAIGVGEEDTTLRDSLASILQEEGVNITEEDDMASLISKVDSEFDRQVVPAGNAVASNVLAGKTFINSTGSTITGTMANNGTKTITPSASTQTLAAGYYDKVTINSASLKLTASSSGSYNLAKTIRGLYITFNDTSANPPVSEVFQCTVTGSGSVYVSLRLIGPESSSSSGNAQFVVSRTRSGSKTEVATSDYKSYDCDQTISTSFTINGLLPGDVLTFGMRNRQYYYLSGTFYVDGVLCNVSY